MKSAKLSFKTRRVPLQLARSFVNYFWREWVRPLALPFLLITAAKSAIADINIVPTGSMKPTILEGDVVFINKLAYDLRVPFTFTRVSQWGDPQRGDIVVCFSPADETRLVKRVIGLPGDTVELRNNVLLVNGVAQTYSALPSEVSETLSRLDRHQGAFAREHLARGAMAPLPAAEASATKPAATNRTHAVMALPGVLSQRTFGPIMVPAGNYFMLGDNRDNSADSRYFGCVSRREIIGEVKGVFVSGDPDRWYKPRLARFFSALE